MRRFRFRLERVLGIRRQWLGQERARMASAVRTFQAADVSCRRAELARQRFLGVTAGRLHGEGGPGRMDGRELAEAAAMLEELARRGAYWAVERARAEKAVDEQRVRLVEAHRRVRVLELLRQRRRGEYLRQVEREERAVLDEVGATAYIRRRWDGS